jgi:hypothetical protein
MGRQRGRLAGIAAGLCLVAMGCTPPAGGGGGGGGGPQPPVISWWSAAGGPHVAPALVPLAWTVSDPDGDPLTCRIDRDNNGTWDLTISNCAGTGARNVTEGVGSRIAVLEVSDGTLTTTASTSFTVSSGTAEPMNITLRVLGSLSGPVQAAFDAARARWEAAIVRGIPDVTVNLTAGQCLSGAAAFSGTVDDVMIDVAVRPIDGSGGILGLAGPCLLSGSDALPRVGVMEFDSADVADLLASGLFTDVVVHEMAHVLGFGTVWNIGRSLLAGAGSPDPRYIGWRGLAEWGALGGTGNVPVEAGGGPSTADAHWRESVFDNELMTGWLDTINPLSKLSIASLADMGYRVDLTQADNYSLPGGAFRAPGSASGVTEPGEVLRPPISFL